MRQGNLLLRPLPIVPARSSTRTTICRKHHHRTLHPIMHLPLGNGQSRKEAKFHKQPPTVRRTDLHGQRPKRCGVPTRHFLEEPGVRILERFHIPLSGDGAIAAIADAAVHQMSVGVGPFDSHVVGTMGEVQRGGEAEYHQRSRTLLHAPGVKWHSVPYGVAGEVTSSIVVPAPSSVVRTVVVVVVVVTGSVVAVVVTLMVPSHGIIGHATRVRRVSMPVERSVGSHGEFGHGTLEVGRDVDLVEGQALRKGAAAAVVHRFVVVVVVVNIVLLFLWRRWRRWLLLPLRLLRIVRRGCHRGC
mmetsp:Transcript_34462/g.72623  ORF Transcript_34462/g.72623 Transcript_34462/m.72623 type:complete len:301 (+) Transcript_34462:201-1103(+)